MTQEEKDLKELFQAQKEKEQLDTPAFSMIFRKAQERQQDKRRTKFLLMAACVSLLMLIGFAINDDTMPINMENVTVAKGSTNLYEKLMADGKIVTNDIHFEYDKAVLKPISFVILQKMGEMLQENKQIRLAIEGHTDSSGDTGYNQQLSSVRAAAVRMALIKMGVEASRLTAKGFGETRPINKNETEKERALNRRVEFVLEK